jgi:hypothetical protein
LSWCDVRKPDRCRNEAQSARENPSKHFDSLAIVALLPVSDEPLVSVRESDCLKPTLLRPLNIPQPA